MHFRDPKLRERFEREGMVVVDLLDADEVAHLRGLWDTHDDPIKQMPFNVTTMSADQDYRMRTHREIAGVVVPRQSALLEGARHCYASLWAKPPNAGSRGTVPLHQDPSSIDERDADTYNFWIALQDVDERNGCLHVVRGSHRLNRKPRSDGAFFAFPYPELVERIISQFLEPIPVRCGQAVVFHETLFHMSLPNMSECTRLAASSLVVPQDRALRHYYQPFGQWDAPLEVYEVEEDFYVRHRTNDRPANARYLGSLSPEHEELSFERLSQAVFEARGATSLPR